MQVMLQTRLPHWIPRDVGLGMLGKKSRDFLTVINTFYQVFSVITTYYNVYQLLKLLPVNIVSTCF